MSGPSPLALREKKRALLEVIELQRRLIQQHEDNELQGVGREGPAAQTVHASNQELRWYANQTKRFEKLKHVLDTLRLQPDEFSLLVPHWWATGRGSAPSFSSQGSSRSQQLVPYMLRINARSQLTFVPNPGTCSSTDEVPAEAGSKKEAALLEDCSLSEASHLPRVYFMDMLRHVRAVRLPDSAAAAGSASGSCEYGEYGAAAVAVGEAACATTSEAAGAATGEASALRSCAVAFDWKSESEAALCCVSPEAEEAGEVIGAHLRRYNQSRVAAVDRLKAVHALKCTPYSPGNASHERLLRRLWAVGFPGVPLEHTVTDHWLHLGFQSADPATDFRGMGILGLANLVYFGEHYPDVFQRLVTAQGKRDYPLACAGINVTSMLLELVHMRDEGSPHLVQERPPFSEEWDSDMLTFFCHMFYRERPFDDMYCFSLRALDRLFVSMDADCADFPSVLAALRWRITETLAQRPLSFSEFKRLVRLTSPDSDSVTSGRESLSALSAAGELVSENEAQRHHDVEIGRVLADAVGAGSRGLETAKARLSASFRDLSSLIPMQLGGTGLLKPRPKDT